MKPRPPAHPRLADRVLAALQTAPITRAQLAARLGISPAHVTVLLSQLKNVERVREEDGRLRYRLRRIHP